MQISNYVRNYTIIKTYGRCAYCGKQIVTEKNGVTFDHVLPLQKNGSTNKENLLLCCFDCNQEKGSLTLEEFRQKRMKTLQNSLKKNGLIIKATGTLKFYFERLTTDVHEKIKEVLDNV